MPGSPFINMIPPKPIMESCSPVWPRARRAMGAECFGMLAFSLLVVATAAAVMPACFKNSRRFMVCLRRLDEKVSVREYFCTESEGTATDRLPVKDRSTRQLGQVEPK